MNAAAVVHRVGLPGFAALLVLAWASWTHWAVEPGLADDIATLQREAREATVRAAAPAASIPTSQALLRDFYARLPDDEASNETLAAVLSQARAEGLTVGSARFQTESTRLPGMVRHRANLPLKGRYSALRQWLARALHDNEGLTLDALELKRRDAASRELEADVALSLWSRTTVVPPTLRQEADHAR